MKRIGIYAVLAVLIATTLTGAGDVLQQLSVPKTDAAKEVVNAFTYGHVNFHRVRNAFKSAAPATRAAMTEQVLIWTKAYVNSPAFAKEYATFREQSKPTPDDGSGMTVDQELAERRKQRQAELEESRKSLAQIPAEYRAAAAEGLKAAEAAMKEYDTPEFRKNERDALILERQEDDENYRERLAKFEQDFPADVKTLVRRRLTEFLAQTSNVDFAAQLVNKNSKMRFANAAYEQKPQNWKLAYRAGKETTEKARAFAEAWLGELK
jgi:phage-related protein